MFLMNQEPKHDDFNRPLYGMVGEYTLSEGMSLPYFLTVMDIERAIEELSVAENIAPSIENKWSLQELFQREIDQERVEKDIIRGYLKDPKKIKFFNALTIVLMPKSADERILESFTDNDYSPPIPWDGADEYDGMWSGSNITLSNFGGVQFAHIGSQARLRWDENKIFAVAVDGQHRLWALRTYKENPEFSGGKLKPTEKNTKIPVIFVLLHEKAGFSVKQDREDHSIRTISRELFTDLNKNAKTVDKARELILDDKSINARCVRTLITDSTSQDVEGKLPLSLVRWQDDSNRFDTSYYLNSLVHLDLMISSLLDLKYPKDPMDADQVNKFIVSLNKALGSTNGKIDYEGKSIDRYYQEDCCDEDGEPSIPFLRLPEHFLSSAVEGFKIKFRPWIIKLLLEFKPYEEILSYSRRNNLIEGNFAGFQAQTKKHKNSIRTHEISLDSNWFEREILSHEQKIASLKNDQWAFKVIFQKALMRLGKLVEFDYKDDNLGSIHEVLDFMNLLYDRGLLSVSVELPKNSFQLWTFIALHPSTGKIKVAKTVEDRIFSVLCLWYFATRKIESDKKKNLEVLSPRKLLNFFKAEKSKTIWPGCNTCYLNLYNGLKNPSLWGGKDAEIDDEQKEKIIKDRLTDILAFGIENYVPEEETEDS